MSIKHHAIMGLGVAILLLTGVPAVHAIYSPEIANEIGSIREHIFNARQLNGTGSARHGAQKVFDDATVEKLLEEDDKARAEHRTTGLPGQFTQYRQQAKSGIAKDTFASFGEDFALMFNRLPSQKFKDPNGQPIEIPGKWITSCLRNDIFTLKKLRDQTLSEALQSALKLNRESAAILWNDYQDVRAMLVILKTQFENTTLLFGEGQTNYYVGIDCPEGGFWGEYGRAIEDLKRSWDTFYTAVSGQGLGSNSASGQWGSIKSMAQARARARATEYIRSNQITLTIGGPEGGSPTSIAGLIRQEGLGGVGNLFKTQWQILKSILGPITPLFDGTVLEIGSDNPCVIYEPQQDPKWRACTDAEREEYEAGKCDRCRNRFVQRTPLDIARDLQARTEERNRDLVSVETTIQFNLQFNTLADANTAELERVLTLINAQIRSTAEAFGERAGKALPTLCKELRTILLKHCANKSSEIPGCN